MAMLGDGVEIFRRFAGCARLSRMAYRLGEFELDPDRFELRRAGSAIAVEPQVLSILLLLVENRDRLVTRDEIIETVWKGRIVSDSAIASRIKSARHALLDDGQQQRTIRTVHGKGFRFIGPVETSTISARIKPTALDGAAITDAPEERARPSIAVLPFRFVGDSGQHALIAEGLPHEVITELCRLRWLFVIARGSSFRFRADNPDIRRIGTTLGVRYCLSGSVEAIGNNITVAVELTDTRDSEMIWGDRYSSQAGGVHELRSQIVASIITALEIQIPLHEAQRARLRPPENLDAWSAYHLGLQHMFRFNHADNRAALALFERAVANEPDFARAHAGLSFVHFQNAFLHYTPDVSAEAAAALHSSEHALEIDALDPFANFTQGRSLWLTGQVEESLGWLDRAIALSPNYAQGIYARAWAETVLGMGEEAQRHADTAIALSPIDPMHYAMLATRALSHFVRGEDAPAARWSAEAARSPGAHVLVAAIAVACHALSGDLAGARFWADNVRRRQPNFTQADFFRSFPFEDALTRKRISEGLACVGLG